MNRNTKLFAVMTAMAGIDQPQARQPVDIFLALDILNNGAIAFHQNTLARVIGQGAVG